MAVLCGLGVASGLPYLLTQDTLAAWLSQAGVEVTTIGLFGLVALPYSFKFVWAPWMDRYVPPLLGRRRGWLILTQLALMAGIIVMAIIGPDEPGALAAAALVVAFLSASQDIVADAYRADVLPPRELGAGAAVFVLGYRLGVIAAGAGVLMLADVVGWRTAFIGAGLLLSVGLVSAWCAPLPRGGERAAPPTLRAAVMQPILTMAQRHGGRALAVLVLFVLLFRLPDTLAGRMTMPFLLSHLGFEAGQVGFVRQFVGIWVMIAGTLTGGALVAKLGVRRSLWVFGLLQAASNGGFLLLTVTGRSDAMLVGVILVESFCGGLVTAGFLAFLMSQCDPRYSATQYAILTSLMAVAGSVLAAVTGYVVAGAGYGYFFGLSMLAGVPGLLLIAQLPTGHAEPDGPDESSLAGES